MGGTRDEDPAGGSGEIYIVAPDGPMDGGSGGPPGVPVRPGMPGRHAALLAVVGLLAFGIGVGVGTHRGDSPAASGESAVSTTADPTAAPTSTRQGRSSTSSAGATTAQRSTAPQSTPREPWPTAAGVCGYETPVPLISGALPLDRAIGLSVMAGGAPSRIAMGGGEAGQALFPTAVEALAEDAAGLVAVTVSQLCPADPSTGSVLAFRLGEDGRRSQIFPTADSQRTNLQDWGVVAGGNRAWLVATPPNEPDASMTASPDSSTEVYTLFATDGSGDSISLPAGFMPVAGWRDLVIGYYLSYPADTYGPIQIYDVASGGIVAQIAAASPQVVEAQGYLAWIDDSCSASCIVHRYELDSGRRTDTSVTLSRSEYGGVGSLAAMSPDGRRVAMITYDAAADSRYELGHPGGPARFSVLDLESGRLTTLPGLLRAPKSPFGLAFSPDAQWLAVAVNDGARTRILLYDHDLRGPYDPGISVPASTAWTIPLVVEQP